MKVTDRETLNILLKREKDKVEENQIETMIKDKGLKVPWEQSPKYTDEQFLYHSTTIVDIFKKGINSGKKPQEVVYEIQQFTGSAIKWYQDHIPCCKNGYFFDGHDCIKKKSPTPTKGHEEIAEDIYYQIVDLSVCDCCEDKVNDSKDVITQALASLEAEVIERCARIAERVSDTDEKVRLACCYKIAEAIRQQKGV